MKVIRISLNPFRIIVHENFHKHEIIGRNPKYPEKTRLPSIVRGFK